MVGVELVEERRSCLLGFLEVDGPVIVGIERLHRPAPSGCGGSRQQAHEKPDCQGVENSLAPCDHVNGSVPIVSLFSPENPWAEHFVPTPAAWLVNAGGRGPRT